MSRNDLGQYPLLRPQQGFLLPLALFIVLILAGLGVTLSRMTQYSNLSVLQEQASLQAFYAAESGAQYAMHRLYFDSTASLTRAAATAECNGIDNGGTGTAISFTATGLRSCTMTVFCTAVNDSANVTTFYNLTSRGNCSFGDILAERTIEVSSYLQ
ncbi:PilX N-terminal domain-containing pilus assembly protein [Marinibactrum halimedae]|uniref:Type 4 fimbrial biogenesis protein PilX N-terminal domain-containing protein n=1 Tax=Marinibactrum halimedae TaxID=1444977 RepID=A0AA37WP13_9GAMM|nr:PilX N-terminal domain-containing pilus assembly protein [Marinibactrum halimedae]MCD9460815.1 hypothetical protein [Marinibactrum halimedae]GLS26721.1 hypothetical protein GCM10007877_24380 [Marinibactrum halimedae]